MTGAQHEKWMRTAIALAHKGRTSPNPKVGALLVRDGKIIARGYHKKAGAAHAEVAAIEKAGSAAAGATLVVTLEPCNHTGRTGPCTDAIIKAGIARVIFGSADPKPHVPGAIDKLRAAGIEVEQGNCREECADLIADFSMLRLHARPFVTLKAAVTLDGKTATRSGESKWISGEASRTVAHQMRAESDAVLVGIGTVLADDPHLTVRHVKGPQPLKILADSDLRTPPNAKLFEGASKKKPVIIAHAGDVRQEISLLWKRRREVELLPVPRAAQGRGIDLRNLLSLLGQRQIMRLLVESGPQLAGALFDADLIDETVLFVAPKVLGDPAAPSWLSGVGIEKLANARSFALREIERCGDDIIVRARARR